MAMPNDTSEENALNIKIIWIYRNMECLLQVNLNLRTGYQVSVLGMQVVYKLPGHPGPAKGYTFEHLAMIF